MQNQKTENLTKLFSAENEAMPLSVAVKLYFKAHIGTLRPSTIMVYSVALDQLIEFLGDMAVRDIKKEDIERWRAWLSSEREIFKNHPRTPTKIAKISIYTVRKHLSHARTFFRWSVDSDQVPQLNHNPFAGIKLPPKPRSRPKQIEDKTIEILLDGVQRTDYSRGHYSDDVAAALRARNTAIIHFLRSTGCRLAGMLSLELADVTIGDEDGHAFVREKGQGKSSERYVVLDMECTIAFLEWLDHHPNLSPNAPAFCNVYGARKGLALSDSGAYAVLARLAKRSKVIGRYSPHTFRHRAVTKWVEEVDVGAASQLAGHSSVTVTVDVYARYNLKKLKTAHKKAAGDA